MGNYEAILTLQTDDALLADFGTANRYDILPELEAFGPVLSFALVSVDGVQAHADGRLSADVVFLEGRQVVHERDYFVEEDGHLKLAAFEDLPAAPPPGESARVEVATVEMAFEPSRVTVPAAEVIVVHGRNNGAVAHEIGIAQLHAGFDPAGLLEGPPPAGAQFVGGIQMEPQEEAEMYLVGLEPGDYALVCFFDEPDGVPHVAKGMAGTFTVE